MTPDVDQMARNYAAARDIWTGRDLEGQDLTDYLWELAGEILDRSKKERERRALLEQLRRLAEC